MEYGTSFSASRQFGIARSMTDTVYNMNLDHLSKQVPTVFESLDDAELRTAGTTYLIYRGRFRHEASRESALARIATASLFRHATWGPRELFYADLFSSRRTGCRSQLGMPGVRDEHTGCVGEYMVEHDLFDFALLSLPDNDTHSHKHGPDAQVESISKADRALARVMEPAGGVEAFLEDHAVIMVSDHAQSAVGDRISLESAFADWSVAHPDQPDEADADIALCPSSRSAAVYVLRERDRARTIDEVERIARTIPGVDVVMRRRGDEAAVRTRHGDELRFAPGGDALDLRGRRWSHAGDLRALKLELRGGRLTSHVYPDALGRIWSALTCPTSGDVLLSAEPGFEFVDWGGADHVGGGSHGSLHRSDSLAALVCSGTGPAAGEERMQWSIRDVTPMVRTHFGVDPAPSNR